jgi:hypothetical protein
MDEITRKHEMTSTSVLIVGAGIGYGTTNMAAQHLIPFSTAPGQRQLTGSSEASLSPRSFEERASPSASSSGMSALTLARKAGPSPYYGQSTAVVSTRDRPVVNTSSRVLRDLLAAVPDDMPPLTHASVTRSLGLHASALFYDKTGKLLRTLGHDDPSKEGYLVCVECAKLRDWLCHNLTIEYGKRLQRFEEHEAGVTAFFADGTSATGSILIGADGTNSTSKPPPLFFSFSNHSFSSKLQQMNVS